MSSLMKILSVGVSALVLAGCANKRQEVYHASPAIPLPWNHHVPAPEYRTPVIQPAPVERLPEVIPAPPPAPQPTPAPVPTPAVKPSSLTIPAAVAEDNGAAPFSSLRLQRLPPVNEPGQIVPVKIEGVPTVAQESARVAAALSQPGLLPENWFAKPLSPEPPTWKPHR